MQQSSNSDCNNKFDYYVRLTTILAILYLDLFVNKHLYMIVSLVCYNTLQCVDFSIIFFGRGEEGVEGISKTPLISNIWI